MSFSGVDGQLLLAKVIALQREYDNKIKADLDDDLPPEYGDDCEHSDVQDSGNGVPVCVECGIEFPERTQYERSYDEYEQFNMQYDSRLGGMVPDPEPYVSDDDNMANDDTEPLTVNPPSKKKGRRKDEQALIPKSPKNTRDLRKMASAVGIPKFNKMSKDELCKVLGVEIQTKSKPDKIIFTNTQTGEELRFHSIYKAAKDMGINPGSVKYYLGREITIGDKVYGIREV